MVINCTGIGAKQLVKSDSHLMPVRGQVIRCKAAWIYEATIEDSHDENYMIPKYINHNTCYQQQGSNPNFFSFQKAWKRLYWAELTRKIITA